MCANGACRLLDGISGESSEHHGSKQREEEWLNNV